MRVELDASSQYLEEFSVTRDFRGFKVILSNQGDFPLYQQNGFVVPVGHHSLISLTATKLETSKSLSTILPDLKGCLFEDEGDFLQLFSSYRQSSCMLECTLNLTLLAMANNNLTQCIVWSLPAISDLTPLCDPFEALDFMNLFQQSSRGNNCSYCLPDCNQVTYKHSITSERFRSCDEKNFGSSPMCNFYDIASLSKPQLFGAQVIRQLQNRSNLLAQFVSDERIINKSAWSFHDVTYHGFETDIAQVTFFFESATAMKFIKNPSQSWISFLSFVGGSFGLFVGVSLITLFEWTWFAGNLMVLIVKTFPASR